MADSIRQNKVASLIQKDLAEIFQSERQQLFGNALVTITTVRVSSDLSLAKVYLSIFSTPDKDAILEAIKEKQSFIRGILGRKIAKQVRIIPEIVFYIDDSLDYALKINDLLKK
jgi:ribosome-binding factor A